MVEPLLLLFLGTCLILTLTGWSCSGGGVGGTRGRLRGRGLTRVEATLAGSQVGIEVHIQFAQADCPLPVSDQATDPHLQKYLTSNYEKFFTSAHLLVMVRGLGGAAVVCRLVVRGGAGGTVGRSSFSWG